MSYPGEPRPSYSKGIYCERCGRDASVKPTKLGKLCQYCRAADMRHIRAVRQLGGMPRIGSVYLTNDEDYEEQGDE